MTRSISLSWLLLLVVVGVVLVVARAPVARSRDPVGTSWAAGSLPERLEADLARSRAELSVAVTHRDPSVSGLHRMTSRRRLESAWEAASNRLREERPAQETELEGPARDIGVALLETDLWFGGPDRFRERLSRLLGSVRGTPLEPVLSRAARDLTACGSRFPPPSADLVPVGPAVSTSAWSPGSFVVVLFWASWDRDSQREWRETGRLALGFQDRAKIRFAAVSLDEDERFSSTVAATVREAAARWPQYRTALAWNSPLARALGLRSRGIPARYLVDFDGRVLRLGAPTFFLELWLRRALAREGAGTTAGHGR